MTRPGLSTLQIPGFLLYKSQVFAFTDPRKGGGPMIRARALRPFVAGAVVVAGLALTASPAFAADPSPAPSATGAATVTVTVPSATPTPQNTKPGGNPPPSNGGSPGGGSPGGGSPGGGGGTGGGGTPGGGTGAGTAAPTEPAIAKSPSTTAEKATVDKTAYFAGDTITVTADGFTPAEKVQIVLYSEPILIGNFPSDATGRVTQAFQLPKDLPAGAHTIQLTGWESKRVATVGILVASLSTVAAPDQQGVPPWAWWAGGALVALLAAAGTWWLVRTMRAPREVPAT